MAWIQPATSASCSCGLRTSDIVNELSLRGNSTDAIPFDFTNQENVLVIVGPNKRRSSARWTAPFDA